MPFHRALAMLSVAGLLACAPFVAVAAEDTVVARVNGLSITERDLTLAESEIGSDIGNLPLDTRRRVLVEYIIETELMAKAASDEKLAEGAAFDQRMAYYRRKALREAYFDSKVKSSISEAAAKTFYDDQVKALKPEEEVKARHILVKTEAEAREIKEKIVHGGDFEALAKAHSQDPGTKDNGGMLGFFSKGQMVPQFEEAAFALQPGDVSQPVESQFGWHLIKVEERRTKPLPTFEEVKERILNAMIHRKAQSVAQALRKDAKIDYVDAGIKKQVEDEEKQAGEQQRMIEEQIKKMQEGGQAPPKAQ
ncbi:MAG: peptidylprolyl isomerase [Hyphomicrobiaceae bacterium]|nr:peptidylprolyl isomerase [Hyphomicrobiaceae bacterium]